MTRQELNNVKAYNTGNIGFDVLRNKNARIAVNSGFDAILATNKTLNHPTIKELRASKLINPVIIGCNLVIFTVDDINVRNRVRTILHTNWTNRNDGLYQVLHTHEYDVNEVLNKRLEYLPTESRNLLRYKARKYNWGFVAGLDIINQQVFNKNSHNDYNKTLMTAEKRLKY